MINNKMPLSYQSDYTIKKIREFRENVKQLRIYRAKGFCEICNQPFGVQSLAIKGHHIIKPTEYIGSDSNCQSNIVICCDRCYQTKVMTGIFKWNNNRPIPKITADETLISMKNGIRTKERYNLRNNINVIKNNKFYGVKFKFKTWNIKIGLSLYKINVIKNKSGV